MKIRRPRTIFAAVAACLLLTAAGILFFKAASVTPASIRAEILARTPIGSSVADVEKAIGEMQLDKGACGPVDKSEITVRYARFYQLRRLPAETVIHVTWHFDPAGNLSDVSLKYYAMFVMTMTEIDNP
jgi:hypothetical protein